jgi:hypothetical protein
MADHVVLDAGSGGDTIAADDVAGVKYQLVQLVKGADGGAKTLITGTDALPVDVIAALPAGSNAIGKLAANSGVDIGDVDVTSIVPGTGASNLGKAEDASHTSADVGVFILGVRRDAPTSGVSADGDYCSFNFDSNGRCYVACDTHNIGTVTTVTAVSDCQVQGKAAHDAAVSGNPVLLGIEARRARMTAVSADGDLVRMAGDRYGRVQVAGVDLSIAAVQATASGDTALIAAPGAGNRLKVLRVEISNSHSSTALTVGLKSASLNGGAVFGKKYLPAAGGQGVWVFPLGHLLCGDNEAFNVHLSAAGQVECTAYYETIAS